MLYYPAGTYDFSQVRDGINGRGLMLKSGVVILGDRPGGDDFAGDGDLELPTKFKFAFLNKGTEEEPKLVPKHWNMIGITVGFGQKLKEVDNVGIAWIHLDGGYIYFGPQMTWGDDYTSAEAWRSNSVFGNWRFREPDGTFPTDPFCGAPMNTSMYEGAGKGRFVFGCKLENSAFHNDFIDNGFGKNGYFQYKFIARIGIYGSRVFIANNLLSKPTRCFRFTQTTSEGVKEIMYDYGFNTGIDVNKNHLNINANKLDPEGGYWEEGVVIKDNWVYNHLFKGFDISGTWMTVQGNTNARDVVVVGGDIYDLGTGWTLVANGYKTHLHNGSGDAFQNRAFDVAGKAVWIDRNEYWGVGTPKPSNDGEGILCQSHGGTHMHSWVLTRNHGHDDGRGYGYMMGWDVDNLGVMMAWNNSPSHVGAVKVSDRHMIDVSFVDNIFSGNGELKSDCGGLSCDILDSCTAALPLPPSSVEAHVNDSEGYVEISWEDGSDDEIGFRIDRREADGGQWTTVVYRPRQSLGHPDNEQKWRDYLAASGTTYQYRVVAVNCDDGEEGATLLDRNVKLTTRVEQPFSDLPSGTYDSPVTVTLDCPTFGAKIRYTMDGSEPNPGSAVYSAPLLIADSTVLKFKAFRDDIKASYMATEVYQFDDQTAISETEGSSRIFLYPVPAEENLYLTTDLGMDKVTLTVIRVDGSTVVTRYIPVILPGQEVKIEGPFQPGIYLVRLTTERSAYTRTFISR